MISKRFLIFVFLLFSIFSISGIYAEYRESSPSYYYDSFKNSNSFFGINEFYGNNDYCDESQDFLLQISPLSCTPAVVRSDLLEEQDVPVFCPLTSIKLNPLIKVDTIENINFGKEYDPKEISGIGFHPYRGALSTSRTSFMNEGANQVYNNQIGYIVVWLRNNRNESSMPDYVSGNISATLRYNADNVFGLKGNSFYLPLLTDDEWKNNMKKYSFWEGRGYLRAEQIFSNQAEIALYSYTSKTPFESDNSQKKLLFRSTLNSGQTSNSFFLPGFGCNAGFKLKLEGTENPDNFIKLKINSEYLDVKEDEKFLDGNCYVESDSLENYGLSKKVVLNCKSYSEEEKSVTSFFGGWKKYSLYVSPKFDVSFNGVSKSYNVGDLITIASNDRKIFLAYVGMVEEGNKEVMKALLLSLPSDYNAIKKGNSFILQDSELEYARDYVELKEDSLIGSLKDREKILLSYEDNGQVLNQLTFKLNGFGKQGEDSVLDKLTEEDYENSFDEFGIVIDEHSGQKYPYNNTISLDKEAYKNEINLAMLLNQKSKVLGLCNEFKTNYPKDFLEECDNQNRILFSNSVLVKNEKGETYTISLEDIYEPTLSDYGVEIIVKNLKTSETKILNLSKDKKVYLKQDNDYYVSLNKIVDEKTVDIYFNLPSTNSVTNLFEKKLVKDQAQNIGDSYSVSIKKIYLKRYARVSIIPDQKYRESTANFNFKINIEKRNIQLAPEKIESKIQDLNKTIDKWNKISSGLGDFVKTMKTACLATEATLTVKHLLMDSGGKSIARTEVMKGENGWNERCAKFVADGKYKSLDECYYKNSNNIDAEVNLYYQKLNEQNNEIKDIQNKHISSESSLFGGKSIDTNAFTKDYSGEVKPTLTGTIQIQDPSYPNDPNKKININLTTYQKYLDYNSQNPYSIDDLKEIDLYNRLIGTSEDETKKVYEQRLYDVLNRVKSNSETQSEQTKLRNKYGSEVISVNLENKKSNKLEIGSSEIKNFEDIKSKFDTTTLIKDNSRVIIASDYLGGGKEYLFELNNKNEVIKTYSINGKIISVYSGSLNNGAIGPIPENPNPFDIQFEVRNSASYKNKYLNAKLKYYETEPYKGLPAIVPFDLSNGWYTYIKQNLAVGSTKSSYDLSGVVTSFYVCNVGKNGMEEFNSISRDDICELVNKGIGQPYNQFPGLNEDESKKLISKAEQAIAQSSKYSNSKNKKVSILGNDVEIGEPALNLPSTQCTDYMSPKECQLMFNVCDPVICPSSRCDFGGAYPVNDVIQSGIIGSLVLCLPNYREGIYVPVCLTGVKAGIDGWLSVLDSYRGCLQENLNTGSTIGICDEINSVYMCEFFWRQAFPIAKLAIPKIIGLLAGQNSRGGGEYMGTQSAWENAQNSLNYFTQNYALNSFNAFKYRSTEQIGADVCKSFVSLSYPAGVDILDQLTEPDSPSQFHGRFDEIPFSTVTNPPISHYKVFYHIYAGNDRGAYYRVYLRGGETDNSYYQSLGVGKMVASGYIGKGDYKTETLDFTAPSGFKELCINVNGDEECGFAQVSTDFAVNYIKDQYVASQVNQTNIKTENECISGTPNIYSMLNPNIQEGADELIDPEIYNKGIIRICSSSYPGQTEGTTYGTDEQRWLEVGYCGDKTMKCWLDKNSISNSFVYETDVNKALETATGNYIDKMLSDPKYISPENFDNNISYINSMNDKTLEDKLNKISFINNLLPQIFFVNEIGKLHLIKGIIYGEIAVEKYNSYLEKVKVEEDEMQDAVGFSSLWFDYDDGKGTFLGGDPNLCFNYTNGWKYFIGQCPGDGETFWISVKNTTFEHYKDLRDNNKDLIATLANSNYKQGVLVLYKEVLKGEGGFLSSKRNLRTMFSILYEDGVFYFDEVVYPQTIYMQYKDQSWMWSLSSSLNSDWLKTPKLAENSEDEWGVSDILKEDHDKIIEHYEEKMIKYLGSSSMNLQKGILYLLEGQFIKGVQVSEEEKVISEEINSCQQNVLNAMIRLEGTSAEKDFIGDVDKNNDGATCYDSVLYIYNEAKVNSKCVYTVGENGKFEVVDEIGQKTTLNDFGPSGRHFCTSETSSACEFSGQNFNQEDKFSLLVPGVMISYASEYLDKNDVPYAPHNAIFVEWIDKNRGLAKLFDWNGRNSEGNKIFQYKEVDISDDSYPVYQIWKPISKDGSCNEEIIDVEKPAVIDEKNYQSFAFELQDGSFFNVNYCYRFFNGNWYWLKGCDLENEKVFVSGSDLKTLEWLNVNDNLYISSNPYGDKNLALMNKLKKKDYYNGLIVLTDEIIGEIRGSNSDLATRYVNFDDTEVLTVQTRGIDNVNRNRMTATDKMYLVYVGGEWYLSLSQGTYNIKDKDKFVTLGDSQAQVEDDDENWMKTKSIKQSTDFLSEKEKSIVNLIKDMDRMTGIKFLFSLDLSDYKIKETQIPITISLEEAIKNSRAYSGYYSENALTKDFVNKLCANNILTYDECVEINGTGFWNTEEDMDFVKGLLIEKSIVLNNGKWTALAAWLKCDLLSAGSYSEHLNEVNVWKSQGVLSNDFEQWLYQTYKIKDPKSDDRNIIPALQNYLRTKWESSSNVDSEGLYEVIKKVKTSAISNGDENKKCNCGTDSDCRNLANYIVDSSNKEGVSPYLVLAVIMQENSCTTSTSSKGAQGIMQITEESYNQFCRGLVGTSFNDIKSDVKLNIACGVRILEMKYSEFKNGAKSSASYKTDKDFVKLIDNCILGGYSKWLEYFDWNAALRGYNGWGCNPLSSDINYVENVDTLIGELKKLA